MSKRRRNPRSKFWKPLTRSAKLAAIVGSGPVTRTEMVSKLWKYIRRNKLQSKSNPRMIKTDEAMGALCKTKGQVSMFDMTKIPPSKMATRIAAPATTDGR